MMQVCRSTSVRRVVCIVALLFLGTVLSQPTVPPPILALQATALHNLYISTGGAFWRNNTGWNQPFNQWETTLCKPKAFFGVECAANKQSVWFLVLTNNNLTGTISSTFMEPFETTLLTLDLSDNIGLTGSLPSLKTTSFVQFVTFARCSFSGTLPANFFPTKMTHIDLQDNQLSGTIPNNFADRCRLRDLIISRNGFTGAIPDTICNCRDMRILDCSERNQFSSMPNCFASDMRGLVIINMVGNKLEGTIPVTWCNATSLTTLHLELNDGLKGELPACISRWTELETLGIEQTNIGGTIPEAVFGFKHLRYMIMSLSRFSGTIPDLFGAFRDGPLSVVTLNGRANDPDAPTLSGTLPQSLFQVRTLETLSVQYTKTNGSIPAFSRDMTRLWKVVLANNPSLEAEFPVSLLTDLWSHPKIPGTPDRELHIENSRFYGTIPDISTPIYDIAKKAGDWTAESNMFEGYLPISALTWIPADVQQGLFKKNFYFYSPVQPSVAGFTNFTMDDGSPYPGMYFGLTDGLPKTHSFGGGSTLTLTGDFRRYFGWMPHNIPTTAINCGFCYPGEPCTNTSQVFAYTPAKYFGLPFQDPETGPVRCTVPPFDYVSEVKVSLFYVGPAYGLPSAKFILANPPQGEWGPTPVKIQYFDPKPMVTAVIPASGRREGCTRVTIKGGGFLYAPNVSIRIGDYPDEIWTSHVTGMQDTKVVDNNTIVADVRFEPKGFAVTAGAKLPVYVYPDGYQSTFNDMTSGTYAFLTTCETSPLVGCVAGHQDGENCYAGGKCRCSSRGNCIRKNGTVLYYCFCDDGFKGDNCEDCTALRYGKDCKPCECVAGHGACREGITNDGTCNCTKWYTGKTCSVSIVLLSTLIPLSVIALGAAAGLLYYKKFRKGAASSDYLINTELR